MVENDLNWRANWVRDRLATDEQTLIETEAQHTLRQSGSSPSLLALKSARGSYVEDISGRTYLDLYGNNCHHIGYHHPRIISAIEHQLSRLSFTARGFTNEPFVELVKKLSRMWPGNDGRVALVPGGSAAVELALAIARTHTGRYKTLSFEDSFHGRSLGAIGLTTVAKERSSRLGPLLPGALHVPSFKTGRARSADAAERSLEAIKNTFLQHDDIACLIAEPIRNGGFRPPSGYWQSVRKLCDKHGTLLVFDEIPTGLGKTGRLFGSEHDEVRPDITVLGKALGGAVLPAAAVIIDGKLDSAPELDLAYFTHEKNPLMACVALATLDILESEQLPARAESTGKQVLANLQNLMSQHSHHLAQVRGCGLVLSADFVRGEPAAADFAHACLDHGLIVNYAGYGATVSFSYPLNVSPEDIEQSLSTIDSVLTSMA